MNKPSERERRSCNLSSKKRKRSRTGILKGEKGWGRKKKGRKREIRPLFLADREGERKKKNWSWARRSKKKKRPEAPSLVLATKKRTADRRRKKRKKDAGSY